jgi:CO/xanthine dehydrogenase FAD-binding subunit
MFDVDYIRPAGLKEAVAFLDEHGQDTTILAGGTDVMVDMRSGDLQSKYLLDVSRLPELKKVAVTGDGLIIGACVTISEIHFSETIGRLAPALCKAADKFASRQVRNIATIGGNVAHCSPCGDTIPPLLIHDANAVVVSPDGERKVPIEAMAGGPYHCTLSNNEVITHFILKPIPKNVGFCDFQKIGRRKELAISRISMAAMAQQKSDKSVSFIRFALGSCTPTPHRFRQIEDFIIGKIPDEETLWEAGRILTEQMFDITGRRSSAIYKEPAIQGLFMRLMYPLVESASRRGSKETRKL